MVREPEVVDESVREAVLRLARAQREFVETWRAADGDDAPSRIERAQARLDAAFRDALRP